MKDEFDRNFDRVLKMQRVILAVGAVVSLVITGALIWGAIYIVGMFV